MAWLCEKGVVPKALSGQRPGLGAASGPGAASPGPLAPPCSAGHALAWSRMSGPEQAPGPPPPPIPSVNKRFQGRRSLPRPLLRSRRNPQMCPRWISGKRSPKKRLPRAGKCSQRGAFSFAPASLGASPGSWAKKVYRRSKYSLACTKPDSWGPRTRCQVQLVPLTTVWQVWVLLQGIDSLGEDHVFKWWWEESRSNSLRENWHVVLFFRAFRLPLFYPFEVHCRGKWVSFFVLFCF